MNKTTVLSGRTFLGVTLLGLAPRFVKMADSVYRSVSTAFAADELREPSDDEDGRGDCGGVDAALPLAFFGLVHLFAKCPFSPQL